MGRVRAGRRRGATVNPPDTSAQLAQVRVLRLVGLHLDPGADHGRAAQVQVELGDLGQVVGQPGDAQEQVDQDVEVRAASYLG